ncbi:plastocyanin/azurin family copper-binding protein [Portibacter marinus]|uniref:plastocyanin/azurin family copper-binding protein n=1 Tax=Portibacter marinus TaxID=2898660 RepID=UPI001F3FB874|nr:plastocyanin/azurin family copper-binding protein [Portibacter marinus]
MQCNIIKKSTLTFLAMLGLIIVHAQLTDGVKENAYYQIMDVPIPDDVILEVGGMVFNDGGKLGITTRRGEIWEITNPASSSPIYSRFAHGLHEPLGLNWRNGSYYLAQRGELTKVTDKDQDGKADSYENIYSWPLDGNYHEYSYGPKFLPNGDMIVSLNLGWIGKGASLSKWRGWVVKITTDGKLIPIAAGMRSPAGIGFNANGDLFYTENQGDWVGSGRMTHVEQGDFVGNPAGLKWSEEEGSTVNLKESDIVIEEETTLYDYSQKVPGVKPPSVWFPHTLMGISTSDLVVIPEGFGPFKGQLLVGDQGHSKIMRVFQERVNGVYQGICFPFREGFESGILRLLFDETPSLYVGMTSRGWSSTGKEMYGLQRLTWNGKVPFEMSEVKIQPDGFLINFTKEVKPETALNKNSYSITDFNYKYHSIYGSPIINQESKQISKIEIGEDHKSVRIYFSGLRKGYIYEINASGVNSKGNEELLHDKGYYTINEIPQGQSTLSDHADHNTDMASINDITSAKRPIEMPGSWTNGPDRTVEIGTEPGLKYDIKEFTVKAASKIKLVFNNDDDMLHNLLIVKPNTADQVGKAAVDLGLQGMEKGYVPDSDNVLYHTNLMQPHTSDAIYFTAPTQPGTYQYVCTFPGHASIMRGVMIVR